MNRTVKALVAKGMLETVTSDPPTARRILEEAARHVEAAQRIATVDPGGAYVLSYDAARKAISAVLLASGYRAMAVPGAHYAIARAAISLGSGPEEKSLLRRLDRMRRERNRSEYGIRPFGRQEVDEAVTFAGWAVEFARSAVG